MERTNNNVDVDDDDNGDGGGFVFYCCIWANQNTRIYSPIDRAIGFKSNSIGIGIAIR